MRKVVLVLALGLGFISFGQDKQCETLQSENNALKTETASLKEEVAYFKNVLEVNKPIMETEKDGISFKITKVEGKKVEQGIALTFLLEAKDTDRKVHIPHGSVVDLEGNEFKINFFK